MPKKQPRNAYYFFMLDFKEEQKKKGIIYQNLAEVQVAADPSWRQAHPSVRSKFEAMAKAEKDKLRGAPDKKFTSTGVSLADIEAEQKRLQDMQDLEVSEIKNFVTQQSVKNTLLEQDIFVIDVNTYCFTGNYYLMGESSVVRFSLLEGCKDYIYERINPGRIPIGYASDVKIGALELGLEMPEEDSPRTEYPRVLAKLMDYLLQHSKGRAVPPLYTVAEKVEQVQDYIRQLCFSSGEDESQLRVYHLETLFFHAVNAISESASDGYPKQSLAVAQLKKDPFKYTPGLACDHHEQADKGVECTKSRVYRWAYTVLDKCCPVLGLDPIPGQHVPHGVDIEGVLTYKESQRDTLGSNIPSIAASSRGGSVINEPLSPSAWGQSSQSEQKQEAALRRPNTNFHEGIREPPELSEFNFPTLGAPGAGRGRGCITRNLNNMSLNK